MTILNTRRRQRAVTTLVATALCVTGTCGASPANAAEKNTPGATAQVVESTHGVIEGSTVSRSPSGFVADSDVATVSIPSSAAGQVSVSTGATENPIAIGIPGGQESTATKLGDLVVYDDAVRDADVAVKADPQGGVQVLIAARSRSAPEAFAFPFELSADARLRKNHDGSVSVVERVVLPDGTSMRLETAHIAAPWATDGRGRSVNTWFDVSGDTVTQHIQHKAATYRVFEVGRGQ